MKFKVVVVDSYNELTGQPQTIEAAHISEAWKISAHGMGYSDGMSYSVWKETVQLNDEQDVAVVNTEAFNIIIVQLDKETS